MRFIAIFFTIILFIGIISAVIPFETAHVKFVSKPSYHAVATADDDDGKPEHDVILEITSSSRQFKLYLRKTANLFSPYYEEVIHEVDEVESDEKKDKPSSLSHKTAPIKSLQSDPLIYEEDCLYDGQVDGDLSSVVSINACQGTLHGMIVLSDGQQYSIEDHPNNLQSSRSDGSFQKMNWDLLQDGYNVSLIDVNEERRILKEPDGGCVEQHTPGRLATALTKLASDAAILSSSTTTSSSLLTQKQQEDQNKKDHGGDNEHHQHQQHSLSHQTSSSGINMTTSSVSDRYVEVVLYHDYERCQSFNTTHTMNSNELIAAIRSNGVELFHNMATYYKYGGFNHHVQLVLKGHVYFLRGDPYRKLILQNGQIRVTGNQGLLNIFNQYRTRYGHYNHDVGLLLSGATFQDNIRGLANVASGCSSTVYNGNINQVTYRNPVMNSVLITHELGHCLSAMHDDIAGFIMSPYVSTSVIFSQRSQYAINNFLKTTTCLINTPHEISSSSASGGSHDSDGRSSSAAMMDGSHRHRHSHGDAAHDGDNDDDNTSALLLSLNMLQFSDEEYNPDVDPLYLLSSAMKEKRKTSSIYLYDLHRPTTYEKLKKDMKTIPRTTGRGAIDDAQLESPIHREYRPYDTDIDKTTPSPPHVHPIDDIDEVLYTTEEVGTMLALSILLTTIGTSIIIWGVYQCTHGRRRQSMKASDDSSGFIDDDKRQRSSSSSSSSVSSGKRGGKQRQQQQQQQQQQRKQRHYDDDDNNGDNMDDDDYHSLKLKYDNLKSLYNRQIESHYQQQQQQQQQPRSPSLSPTSSRPLPPSAIYEHNYYKEQHQRQQQQLSSSSPPPQYNSHAPNLGLSLHPPGDQQQYSLASPSQQQQQQQRQPQPYYPDLPSPQDPSPRLNRDDLQQLTQRK